MKVGLQLGMGQQLTMTPQLQQAIKLLQLSTIELQQEVQAALDANPLLERDDGNTSNEEAAPETPTPEDTSSQDLNLNERSDLPEDLPVDTAWDDVFVSSAGSGGEPVDEDGEPLEARRAHSETLQDHLRWQLNLTPFSDTDRVIAEAIIDAIDERGYLGEPLLEIQQAASLWLDEEIEEDEVLAVLHRIQHFEPAGVAARNLPECLVIQLKQRPEDTPYRGVAIEILSAHVDLLSNADLPGLTRALKQPSETIQNALALIRQLRPHPGDGWGSAEDERHLIPDVVVRKIKGRWRVELNPEAAPKLRVNTSYANLVKRADTSRENQYIKDHLQEARWLIKSLQSRHETLLKVATCIVEHQLGFLEEGPEAMRPLILRDVADEVSLHESTISRVTTQKYLLTPRGLFELKYFFSSHVGTSAGGEASSTAIRAMIKKLIGQENPAKPLSDSKLASLLEDQGIEVARRTVAKYRESLNIASSSDRKRLL